MKSYKYWENVFGNKDMSEFNSDTDGVVWLKIRAIERRSIQSLFIADFEIPKGSLRENSMSIYELYQKGLITVKQIDDFLRTFAKNELNEHADIYKCIETDLYRVNDYVWGGDANNSLDKRIVTIVKNTLSYDEIVEKIDNDIYNNMRNYTLNSWYNNWSAILTENIFKEHPKVISSIGRNKSVDFFIDGLPVDLKVTFLPVEYMNDCRQRLKYKKPETLLKNIAKEQNISLDSSMQIYQMVELLRDLDNSDINKQIDKVMEQQQNVIACVMNDRLQLMKWLYEQQGANRFGAENRLYIVLVDHDNLHESWKLKRNMTLMRGKINAYLDAFVKNEFLNNKIEFDFEAKHYHTVADIIFVEKK